MTDQTREAVNFAQSALDQWSARPVKPVMEQARDLALEGERDYAVGEMKNAQAYWRAETAHAEAAEPFFRLANAVIHPVNGDRPWHTDSADWTVVFSFAGESLTLGDLRKAATPSAALARIAGMEAGEVSEDVRKQVMRLVSDAKERFDNVDTVADRIIALLATPAAALARAERAEWAVQWLIKHARDEYLSPEERLSIIANYPAALSPAPTVGEGE